MPAFVPICCLAVSATPWLMALDPAGGFLDQAMTVDGKPEYRTRPITVECRARLNSARNFNILIASDSKDSSDHWELYSLPGSGEFSVYQPGWGGVFSSKVNICDGKWHHLAAYIGQDVVKLYVDGVLVLEAPAGQTNNAPVPGGLAFLTLVEGGLVCDGAIDDVRISRGERQVVADNKPADERTLGLWGFDDMVPKPAPTPDNRASLPEFQTIPAASTEELTAANGWPSAQSYREWSRSLGGGTSNRFSALDQINRANVRQLEVAWTYHSNDGTGNIQCNPIIVDGVIYLPTAGGRMAAVNGETGEEIWRVSLDSTEGMIGIPARRGLLYWPGDSKDPARLIVGKGTGIFAIDPKTGALISSFGQNGRAELPTGATVAGAVWQDVLVMPGFGADVFGFDIRTGKQLWRFNTLRGNCWGGMALDESRGIAYVATGAPKPNFIGVDHPGDNLFSNCVIALDAGTGKGLWHFQEIRHDIWDMDIPAPPNLVTVLRDGKRVDAVAQVTKYGNTLLLDRVTGKPLFPFRLRKALAAKLPGEETAVYQPYLELPEPFARQEFTREDITDRTPEARAFVEKAVANANMGWFESFELNKPTVFFGIHGGAEWTGAAADPASGKLYVSTNHIPWAITVVRDAQGNPAPSEFSPAKPVPPGVVAGEQVYKQSCAICHGPDREGNGMIPPLKGIASRLGKEDVIGITKNGKNAMPPASALSDQQREEVAQFLLADNAEAKPGAPPRYTFTGYNKLLDQEGYPGNKPPWGTLDCIDLNTGKKTWSVPLGECPELTGIKKTGTENFGGPIVTGGGLVFCSGTRDKKLRAFDSENGAELWSAELPLHGTAPPATYEIKGRQYIILPATGGGKLGGPTGDAWVSFALPKSQ